MTCYVLFAWAKYNEVDGRHNIISKTWYRSEADALADVQRFKAVCLADNPPHPFTVDKDSFKYKVLSLAEAVPSGLLDKVVAESELVVVYEESEEKKMVFYDAAPTSLDVERSIIEKFGIYPRDLAALKQLARKDEQLCRITVTVEPIGSNGEES